MLKMKINGTSGADKNIIIHSNSSESIELIDSFDTSFTVSENHINTIIPFFAESKQEHGKAHHQAE